MLFGVHLLPLIVVAALNIILGMVYYSPYVMGKLWAESLQIRMDNCKPTAAHWIGIVVIALLTTWTIGFLLEETMVMTVSRGLGIAFVAWILVAAQHLSAVIWLKKPIKTYAIDSGWQLLSFLITGAILSVWR